MKKKTLSLLVLLLVVSSMLNAYTNKLYVFNWTEYMNPEIVKEFEKKYDCAVIEDYFDSNESMLTKIVNATRSYDLVCPTADHVQVMLEMNLLQKLNKSKLPNWQHLNPSVLDKLNSFDKIDDYAMPYFWGVTNILYNPEFVDKVLEADQQIKEGKFTAIKTEDLWK